MLNTSAMYPTSNMHRIPLEPKMSRNSRAYIANLAPLLRTNKFSSRTKTGDYRRKHIFRCPDAYYSNLSFNVIIQLEEKKSCGTMKKVIECHSVPYPANATWHVRPIKFPGYIWSGSGAIKRNLIINIPPDERTNERTNGEVVLSINRLCQHRRRQAKWPLAAQVQKLISRSFFFGGLFSRYVSKRHGFPPSPTSWPVSAHSDYAMPSSGQRAIIKSVSKKWTGRVGHDWRNV